MTSSAFVPTKARNSGSRRCRKPLFLLVGVAPQTPFSAQWPWLAACSFHERCYSCYPGKDGACAFLQNEKRQFCSSPPSSDSGKTGKGLSIFAKLPGTAAPNAVKNALDIVGLPYRDKKLFSKYSLGMKQRLGIANAILHDPELLILDEPTNGLDPIGIAEVRDFIKDLSTEHGKTILISSHILSEIALLADDIGIIDHGVLLEENSMETLKRKNSKYILLQVSDIPKTSLVLERQFGVTDYSVQDDHSLRIYNTSLDMAAVNKALVVQDVAVISSQLCNDTLEDYFKKITGGEGIA